MSTNSSSIAGAPTAITASDPSASPNGDAKPAVDSPDRPALRHPVLAAIYKVTKSAALPPAWGVSPSYSLLRQLSCPAAELAELLRARFTIEQLLEVGVFERASGDAPTLSAKLGAPSSKLRFITEGERYADIHSANGALLDPNMPAVRYALARAEKGQYYPEQILLAANDDDVNLLSSLGHYCRWATGLDAICGPELRKIFQRDDLNNLRLKYRLLLVAWQPAILNRRPAPLIVKILERFLQAEQLYGFDIDSLLGVWRPTPKTFSSIRSAIDFQDEDKIRQILAHSPAGSILPPADALFAITKPPEPDYGTALRNLTQTIERCREIPRPDTVRAAVAELNQIYDKIVVQKLHAESAAINNPRKKILLIHAARLATAWHQRQSIFDSARRVMAMETVQVPADVSLDELKDQCRIIDELLKVFKELERLKG